MKHEDSILVENILYNAISTFHDCDDKEKRNKYIKEFTLNFCQEHGLNPSEVVGKLKEMFEHQTTNQYFKIIIMAFLIMAKNEFTPCYRAQCF